MFSKSRTLCCAFPHKAIFITWLEFRGQRAILQSSPWRVQALAASFWVISPLRCIAKGFQFDLWISFPSVSPVLSTASSKSRPPLLPGCAVAALPAEQSSAGQPPDLSFFLASVKSSSSQPPSYPGTHWTVDPQWHSIQSKRGPTPQTVCKTTLQSSACFIQQS